MLKVKLHIFPLLELGLLVGAFVLWDKSYLLSAVCVLGAALFLNFTLHITVHHFVHFKTKIKWLNELLPFIYSVLLALPYDFYRLQHYNHHRYNNLKGDVTSTWEEKNGTLTPKPFFRYAFLWFLVKPSPHFMTEAAQYGDLEKNGKLKMRLQFGAILGIYAALLYFNPFFALYYAALFYFGWTFIAITNYGQHLPVNYGQEVGHTFKEKRYNKIFFNNGLHYEHHTNPGLDYPELEFGQKATIRLPHILAGFFIKINRSEK